MGCTPSIHVSQTGVVYCRDNDEANAPHGSVTTTNHQLHGHKTDSAKAKTSETRALSAAERGSKTMPGIEAETQTAKEEHYEIRIPFGPLLLYQRRMQILFVFPKDDLQSDNFIWAARKGGFTYNFVKTPEHALESYMEHHHDIVIIDHRRSHKFDPSSICKSLRCSSPHSYYTVFLAIIKKGPLDEVLRNSGLRDEEFDRRYYENITMDVCLNELLMLERNDVRAKLLYRTCNALCSALDSCSEAVKITADNRKIQYVNSAHERLTGYSSEELLGRYEDELIKSDISSELSETIQSHLKKGKNWEGRFYTKKKSGESVPHLYVVTPVLDDGGRYNQYVSIRRLSQELTSSSLLKDMDHKNGNLVIPRRISAKTHGVSLEAPITKVINIINTAQKNSPYTVAQTLDQVVEILRSAELYLPQLPGVQTPNDDQMTSDLVGGLMSATPAIKLGTIRRQSTFDATKTRELLTSTFYPITQCPQSIKIILDNEHSWDFDILELERLTNKRPLVWLGMKTLTRFGGLELLNCTDQIMRNWLQVIEANYHSTNSYHNSTHATDVLHATAYFLDKEKMKSILDPMDEVASLIAAIIHDLDHPGRTNSFLCNSQSDLALLYNDMAVLESHHVALAFKITASDERINIFRNMGREEFRAIRQIIIDMVLATEMTKHFEHLSKFVNSINKPITVESPKSPNGNDYFLILATPENRKLIRRMMIKCADVSNPVRPLKLCIEWAVRIAEEYFSQTAEEKARGLPVVMPVFDRGSCSIPKSQTSFIDYFITDMFSAWDTFLSIPEIMAFLNENYLYWKQQEEKEKERQLLRERRRRGSKLSDLEFSEESRRSSEVDEVVAL